MWSTAMGFRRVLGRPEIRSCNRPNADTGREFQFVVPSVLCSKTRAGHGL